VSDQPVVEEGKKIVEEVKKAGGMKKFFMKNGEFSKTSTILVVAWIAGLAMWVVQGLAAGASLWGWVIPPFNSSDFLAVVGAASALYFGNHNIKTKAAAESE